MPFIPSKDHFTNVAGDGETLFSKSSAFISAGREALSDVYLRMDALPLSSQVLVEILILADVMCKAQKVPPPSQFALDTGYFCFLLVSLGLCSLPELAQMTLECPGTSKLPGGMVAGGYLNDLSGASGLSQSADEPQLQPH